MYPGLIQKLNSYSMYKTQSLVALTLIALQPMMYLSRMAALSTKPAKQMVFVERVALVLSPFYISVEQEIALTTGCLSSSEEAFQEQS